MFCMLFDKNIFHAYFIIWPNFIVGLPLLFEILGNMCIVMFCCPVCDIINFEINHNFVIKPFFYITKKSELNVNISRMERAFKYEMKSIFDHFKKTFNCKKLSQTRELAFKHLHRFSYIKLGSIHGNSSMSFFILVWSFSVYSAHK